MAHSDCTADVRSRFRNGRRFMLVDLLTRRAPTSLASDEPVKVYRAAWRAKVACCDRPTQIICHPHQADNARLVILPVHRQAQRLEGFVEEEAAHQVRNRRPIGARRALSLDLVGIGIPHAFQHRWLTAFQRKARS